MKVLFVASGNVKVGKVNTFIQSQYDSLVVEGIEMSLFTVNSKGWYGYLKAACDLRKVIKNERPDIIHAHYSLCGFVASLATIGMKDKPRVFVSILGAFLKHNFKWFMVRWAVKHLWDGALTKSERTSKQLGLELPVVPNGVNLDFFKPMDKDEARRDVGFDSNCKYIIWCSNPKRPEKNWPLAEVAVNELQKKLKNELQISLVVVCGLPPEKVMTYMNAADCLLLTSDSEGSPNVIKEAMACNCPIVATDVGDVYERINGLKGCYIIQDNDCRFADMQYAAGLIANDIEKVLRFDGRTNGRQRLIKDGLEISQIAKRIKNIYDRL